MENLRIWPYCKNRQFDKRLACPMCGQSSVGYYQDGELVMSMTCPEFRKKGRKEDTQPEEDSE